MTNSDVTEDAILLVEDRRLRVEGCIEIVKAFQEFKGRHPGANRYELSLRPAPWRIIGAQPFLYLPEEKKECLYAIWKKQMDEIMSNRGPELLRELRSRNLTKAEKEELDFIKKYCPHHRASLRDFRTNGENCDICGD